MRRNNKLSAYILRSSTAALPFWCMIVVFCLAINLPGQAPKAALPQNNVGFGASRSLSFAERAAYQTKIEDVYWRHRIWPHTNPGPKPPLDKVMSQTDIEKKVTDYLRNSRIVEDYTQRPITPGDLQAEIQRMASHTRQPEVLKELFEALGSDLFVIAECLARPIVAERLLDEVATPHVPVTMVSASASYTLFGVPTLSTACTGDSWTATSTVGAPDGRQSHTAVWTGTEMIVWGGNDGRPLNTGGRYNPTTDSWTATSDTNAPEARSAHTAVWTGTEMIVWGGYGDSGSLNTGGRYNPGTDSWTAINTANAPSARAYHTAIWTDTEMIVWGGYGYLNTGARYNPSTDSWTATTTTNAPDPRDGHTAVWTGGEMIVWGGANPVSLNSGGRYNPSTDSWTATSTTNAPSARAGQTAVWTDIEMIVWGGTPDDGSTNLNTGGRYDPSIDAWMATSTTNAPDARHAHTAVWTGCKMIAWGGDGVDFLNTGGRYDPSTDSWTNTSTASAPDGRQYHTAVWTGEQMIVWGGFGVGGFFNTGGRYGAAALSPTPTPTGSPSATATSTATVTPTATVNSTPRAIPTPRLRPTAAPRP